MENGARVFLFNARSQQAKLISAAPSQKQQVAFHCAAPRRVKWG
jgi:hypothetical protein